MNQEWVKGETGTRGLSEARRAGLLEVATNGPKHGGETLDKGPFEHRDLSALYLIMAAAYQLLLRGFLSFFKKITLQCECCMYVTFPKICLH